MSTYKKKDYLESESVKQAQSAYDQHQTTKPGEYQASQYQQIADEALTKYMNRDKFSYDLNGDALYQQYKDKFVQQGKMAMMDTMGQAQAMTGGYGNSYAQSVGQQAYNAQLQNLNDVVPELYQMAYDKYNQEGQDLYNRYAVAADRENAEYGRYQDKVSQWNTENDRLYNQYLTERDFDYGQYVDAENFNYQQEQDRIAQENWQKEFEEAQRKFNEQMTLTKEQWEWEKQQAALNAVGGDPAGPNGDNPDSPGGSGGGSYDNGQYSMDVVRKAQEFVGADADGMWGANSAAAAKKKGYNSLADVVKAMDGGDKPTYESIVGDLNTYIRNGAQKNEIDDYIRNAYYAGYITKEQHDHLKGNFAPRSTTYR